MAPPPELNKDAAAEILLRLPPDDPALLLRASAVCKPWLWILTDPAFLRRYHDFHGTTPPRVLGFFHNPTQPSGLERFVPTTAFRPQAAAAAHHTCKVVDCRHGRVLIYDYGCKEFIIWDPITGHEQRIPNKSSPPSGYYHHHDHHAVLCAASAAGCDHSTCSGGPFVIASADVFSCNAGDTDACSYSSETGAWRKAPNSLTTSLYSLEDRPAALVGGALYFATDACAVLRYDVLGGHGLSLMKLPPGNNNRHYNCGHFLSAAFVMTAANGGLGLATIDYDDDYDDGTIILWLADEMGPYGDAKWLPIKDIRLQELLPMIDDIGGLGTAWLSGFAEDTNVIFLSTVEDGIFTIDLKSLVARKVSEMGNVKHVFPYVSFHDITVLFSTCARGALQSVLETQ